MATFREHPLRRVPNYIVALGGPPHGDGSGKKTILPAAFFGRVRADRVTKVSLSATANGKTRWSHVGGTFSEHFFSRTNEITPFEARPGRSDDSVLRWPERRCATRHCRSAPTVDYHACLETKREASVAVFKLQKAQTQEVGPGRRLAGRMRRPRFGRRRLHLVHEGIE